MWKLYYTPVSCALASHVAPETVVASAYPPWRDFSAGAERLAEFAECSPPETWTSP